MTSQRFPPALETVPRVRQMIRQAATFAETFDVELVASELVTNVIRHAKTDLVVSLDFGKERVRIEVFDGSSVMPPAKGHLAETDGSSGGVGLRMVEAISERWGADQCLDGKVVWAEIRNVPKAPYSLQIAKP